MSFIFPFYRVTDAQITNPKTQPQYHFQLVAKFPFGHFDFENLIWKMRVWVSVSGSLFSFLRFFFSISDCPPAQKCLWQQINQDINNPRQRVREGGRYEAAVKKGFSGQGQQNWVMNYWISLTRGIWNFWMRLEEREREREKGRERESHCSWIWQPVEALLKGTLS